MTPPLLPSSPIRSPAAAVVLAAHAPAPAPAPARGDVDADGGPGEAGGQDASAGGGGGTTGGGGYLASGSRDKTVRIWHVATGACVMVLEVRRRRRSRDA